MLAITPSGSWVIRSSSFCPASAKTFSSCSARADSCRKKSSRPRRPFNSLRDWRIGLPTSCVSVRASVSCMATIRSRNAAIAASLLLIGTFAHFRWPARASSYLRRTAAALSAVISVITVPSAGLMIFMQTPKLSQRVLRGLVRSGGGEKLVEDRRVVENGSVVRRMELGVPLHREDVTRPLVADRFDKVIRLGPSFDGEITPQILERLVVDRIRLYERDPGVELRDPAAGGERRCVTVLLVDRPVAVSERSRNLSRQVLPQRSPLRDVDDLRAATHAQRRLAQRHERPEQRDLVVVANAITRPLGLQRFLAIRFRTDIRAAHQQEPVEGVRISLDRRLAARPLRPALGRGDHERQYIALHQPVRDVLLDVLERHPLEDRPLRVFVEEAGSDADFQHDGQVLLPRGN